ncbi:uncharacterized protein A4U43_C08F3920 [Asparagus officinalis]|nr:uncharacterized protein A4U43_C08F3920 [Asparagus officinalis]
MARPPQDAIDTFISITGASEAVAVRMLEEHNADLNAAVNAHFNEGDRASVHTISHPAPQNDFMDTDDVIDVDSSVPAHPLLSAAQNLNPFSLINSSFGQRIFDGATSDFSNRIPRVSHPREVREIPIEFKDGDGNSGPSASFHGPNIEEVTGSIPAHVREVRGNVVIGDDDDDLPSAPGPEVIELDDVPGRRPDPNFTPAANVSDYSNDIEEEMIRAAIEASKRDAEASASWQFDIPNGSSDTRHDKESPVMEDADVAHAVSLSLKSAEQEKALRAVGLQVGEQSSDPLGMELEDGGKVSTANGRQGFFASQARGSGKLVLEEGSKSIQEEAEDVEEQPLVRHRSRPIASVNVESPEEVHSPTSSPGGSNHGSHEPNGDAFQSDEVLVISG